ncbi:uncharacterized protein LOC128922959 [Zeugodacus cucurbitae]|uniref:uncharacterized protein LOC128922959 n=1 Tax=Zeugodacus cucurbitae TaxID=28588 RepID=UPI0023D94385|nr:uncharacterized protein LOC128922959 [Zeugodacus cucurbitae]
MERETREMAIQNIKLIQPFDGDRNYLALFIQGVDAIMPQSPVISEETKVFYLHCVIKILRGAALDVVRREQPPDWITLRQLLIDEFGEHTAVSTLILEISNIKFKNNVKLLCEEINLEVCKVKDVIKLKNESCSTKIFLYNELDQINKIHGSNQSRLRRFGYPVPMEQDEVNFHLTASENSTQLN